MDRLYCTVAQVVGDLEKNGISNEAKLMGFIRAASEVIDKRGKFVPTTETRRYDGSGKLRLPIDFLLALTSLVDGSATLASTDYLLYPRNRHWESGPYTCIEIDPDSSYGTFTDKRDNVVVAGRWGLYEEAVLTGATVASQTDSSTALVVNDASNISPGAVLLIGSEQELVEATSTPTDSTANTAEALDNAEEEMDLDNAALLNIGEIVRVDFEQMKVLDKHNNTALVVRGWNGTRKATHNTSADVYVYRTFTVKRGVNGTTAAAHTNAAISRYLPPYSISYLCSQIAGLMQKKSESGWAGKVGSPELGEVFYVQEFPGDPLKKIMANFRIVDI